MPELPGSGRRLRVLQLGKYYWPDKGGIETVVKTLSEGLRDRIDVEVLVASRRADAGDSVVHGVRVSRAAPAFRLGAAAFCPEMVGRLRRARPDLIHLHVPNPGAELAVLASRLDVPLVVTYHCEIVRQKALKLLYGPFHRALLRRASAILVSSRELLSRLPLAGLGDRCHVISHGIPTSGLQSPDPAAVSRLRARYKSRMVLSVGRLVYYKGFEYLIRAMQKVDGHLVIVGEGPLRGRLEALIRACGLEKRVTLAGEVEDLAPFYHAADIFVLASTHATEAFGLVQVEAMSCGKPVVNTSIPTAVSQVSLDGVTGITVPPADAPALARAITRLLDHRTLREEYGAAARQRVAAVFGLDGMLDQVLDLYGKVCGSPQLPLASASARSFAIARSTANRSL